MTTSVDVTPPASGSGSVRIGTVGPANQTNIFGLEGQAFTAIGNGGVDEVFVAAGAKVDATHLGVGQDKIYLEGTWSSYQKTHEGFQLVLTREIYNAYLDANVTEEVRVIGGIGASNDMLHFRDGSVSTRDALLAVRADPLTDITQTANWDSGNTSFSSAVLLEGTNNLTLTTDSGDSASDGNTNVGEVAVNGLAPGFAWQYSVDGGATWLLGSGSSFMLDAQGGDVENGAVYDAGQILVRQISPFGVASSAISNADQIVVDNNALEPTLGMAEYGLELPGNENDNSVSVTIDHGDSLTVQYWVYLDAAAVASANRQQLVLGPTAARLENGNILLYNGADYEDSGVGVSEGWNFVSVSRHGTAFDIVVVNDDNPSGAIGSITRDLFSQSTDQLFRIGENNGGSAQLSGVVRDLRIWDAARDQAQVVADSAADTDVSTEADLIGYWRLDAASGSPVNEVAAGPELTLNGDAALGGDASGYPGGNQRFVTSLQPVVSGGGAAGFATVEVFYTPEGGVETSAGEVRADENGDWQFEFASELSAGEYAIRVQQTDVAGNTASVSAVISAGPVVPNAPHLDAASDTGFKDDDNITSNTTPTLRGEIPAGISAGTTISIFNFENPVISGMADGTSNGLTITYGVAGAAGTWEYTPPTPLAENVYAYSVEIGGVRSAPLNVTVDLAADAPTIVAQPPAIIEEAAFVDGDLVVSGGLAPDIHRVELRWNDNSDETPDDLAVDADIEVRIDDQNRR